MPRLGRIAVFVLAVFGSLPASAADDLTLFNGKDLDGWVAEGASEVREGDKVRPVWTVKDGHIRCDGKGFGFLRYGKREFADFTFHVEFRMEAKCNSGVGVRTTVFEPAKSRATRPSMYSYEIQLIDDFGKPADVHSSASLYRYVAPTENAIKSVGEWNTLKITCVGPRVKVVFNNRTVVDVDQTTIDALKAKPLKGYVCLQNHGGNIEFREVRIREVEQAAKTSGLREAVRRATTPRHPSSADRAYRPRRTPMRNVNAQTR